MSGEFDKRQHIIATIAELVDGDKPEMTADDLVRLLRHRCGLETMADERAPHVACILLTRALDRGAFATDPEIDEPAPSIQHLLIERSAKMEGSDAWLLGAAARMINALKTQAEHSKATIAVLQGRLAEGPPVKSA